MDHFNRTTGSFNPRREDFDFDSLQQRIKELRRGVGGQRHTQVWVDESLHLADRSCPRNYVAEGHESYFIFHPNDRDKIPDEFIKRLEELEVKVQPNIFFPVGKIAMMGGIAYFWNLFRFDQAVQRAMVENSQFLELLKRNGLLDATDPLKP